MPFSGTVVLNCAGRGTRLGAGETKALVHVHGRAIVEWQLDALEDVTDIRIVVGYRAENLIDYVVSRRPDVMFVFNHDFETTATGNSFLLGAQNSVGPIVSLDGDLLVLPGDLRRILDFPEPCIAITHTRTEQPMGVSVDRDGARVVGFGRKPTLYEWTGLAKVSAQHVEAMPSNPPSIQVCDILEHNLPLRAVVVDAFEVDTPADKANATSWLATHINGGTWL
jgi:choline kinase